MSNFNFIHIVRWHLPLDVNPPDTIILLLPNSVWLKALESFRLNIHTHIYIYTVIAQRSWVCIELPPVFYPINCTKEKGLSLKTIILVYLDSTHTTLPFSAKLIPSRTESTLWMYSFLFVPVFTFLWFFVMVFMFNSHKV